MSEPRLTDEISLREWTDEISLRKENTARMNRALGRALMLWHLLVLTVASLWIMANVALADVSVSATAPPASDGLQDLVNWTSYTGSMACVGTAMYGFAKMGLSHRNESFSGANHGKSVAMLGVAGALGLGVTPTIVNALTAIH